MPTVRDIDARLYYRYRQIKDLIYILVWISLIFLAFWFSNFAYPLIPNVYFKNVFLTPERYMISVASYNGLLIFYFLLFCHSIKGVLGTLDLSFKINQYLITSLSTYLSIGFAQLFHYLALKGIPIFQYELLLGISSITFIIFFILISQIVFPYFYAKIPYSWLAIIGEMSSTITDLDKRNISHKQLKKQIQTHIQRLKLHINCFLMDVANHDENDPLNQKLVSGLKYIDDLADELKDLKSFREFIQVYLRWFSQKMDIRIPSEESLVVPKYFALDSFNIWLIDKIASTVYMEIAVRFLHPKLESYWARAYFPLHEANPEIDMETWKDVSKQLREKLDEAQKYDMINASRKTHSWGVYTMVGILSMSLLGLNALPLMSTEPWMYLANATVLILFSYFAYGFLVEGLRLFQKRFRYSGVDFVFNFRFTLIRRWGYELWMIFLSAFILIQPLNKFFRECFLNQFMASFNMRRMLAM